MDPIAQNLKNTVADAIERLLSRAENSRGLRSADISVRVQLCLGKYLLHDNAEPTHAEVKAFIDDIQADDLCLVIACERGDEKAWEDMVANFDATVKSAARKFASNREDTNDLASSIWAELYGLRLDAAGNKKSKLAYYSGRGSLGGWLRAVVSQLAVDQFRKQSKLVQIEEDREFENLANQAFENNAGRLVAHADDPEDILTEKQTAGDVAKAVSEAIGSLDAEDKLVLKLYYFDGLKLKDIAAAFGYHEATASRKLTRVQSDIRRSVENCLREQHGWTESEVKLYLSDTASKLGMDLEKLFAIVIGVLLLQDFFA